MSTSRIVIGWRRRYFHQLQGTLSLFNHRFSSSKRCSCLLNRQVVQDLSEENITLEIFKCSRFICLNVQYKSSFYTCSVAFVSLYMIINDSSKLLLHCSTHQLEWECPDCCTNLHPIHTYVNTQCVCPQRHKLTLEIV